ncbi:hypothetical protein P4361_00405 [Fictibacillus sp. B-59209]|uniref:hypothetical protein n=1 Tax=Fictibacillus sp. B-59209 TaxID=3024873 RepID=UPI0006A793D8|nr:hypothetical protein [Fictibacillus sp. B-59209]MED2970733.1 hypothetical protein [Fictibacillus sp. B-59209]
MDKQEVIQIIKQAFNHTEKPVEIPLLKGNRTFNAKCTEEGIYVSNLHTSPFLPWEAFTETVSLLEEKNGRAIKGDAMTCKLGESGLPVDSVEGRIAYKVYKKQLGKSVFRRITPVACILEWAGLCENGRGELRIKK